MKKIENLLFDIGDSDNEEEVFKEVVIKVFKDLPGTSKSVNSMIENAIKARHPELDAIQSKSIQLSGYDTCRRVAVDFMKNVVKYTPKIENNTRSFHRAIYSDVKTVNYKREFIENRNSNQFITNQRQETISSDYEIKSRMLKSLDLHLAIKQRDYTARLMRH